jgi:hypothetical protein
MRFQSLNTRQNILEPLNISKIDVRNELLTVETKQKCKKLPSQQQQHNISKIESVDNCPSPTSTVDNVMRVSGNEPFKYILHEDKKPMEEPQVIDIVKPTIKTKVMSKKKTN